MLVALAGGVGAARFLSGLVRTHNPDKIVVVGNTADDLVMHGLHISPDLDSVAYTLAGVADTVRGWGRADETWQVRDTLAALGEPDWFSLGDRDLAVHLLRTRLLHEGHPLSAVTAEICQRLGVPVRMLPMSDDPVRTRIQVDADPPFELGFQEWWVQRRARDRVGQVRFDGADRARPAPGLLDAINAADGIILCPSNPVVSIAPILAVPGIRDALVTSNARVAAITPVIGGKPVRGMVDRLLPAWNSDLPAEQQVSAFGVARHYAGLADAFVLDEVDADQADLVRELGMEAVLAPTLMRTPDDAERLARTALDQL